MALSTARPVRSGAGGFWTFIVPLPCSGGPEAAACARPCRRRDRSDLLVAFVTVGFVTNKHEKARARTLPALSPQPHQLGDVAALPAGLWPASRPHGSGMARAGDAGAV